MRLFLAAGMNPQHRSMLAIGGACVSGLLLPSAFAAPAAPPPCSTRENPRTTAYQFRTPMDRREGIRGSRPIAAFGNSDGDLAMLRWVTSGSGPRLGMLVHHDDPRREVAYDRSSPFGRLDRGLEQAPARGWGLISMREEWATVYAGSEGP